MNLQLPEYLSGRYKSSAQRARVLTEFWAERNVLCPSCSNFLIRAPINNPATDFYCNRCQYDFELKSKKGKFGEKIVDGAFLTMMARINNGTQPNLLLLGYDHSYYVQSLALIPRVFLVREIIEKRRPLGPTARRAGWIGCNICIGIIPFEGRIFYIRDTKLISQQEVGNQWAKSRFLEAFDPASRGWIVSVMECVKKLGKNEFFLREMYGFEEVLQRRYPGNRNIRPKIRQQLQVLRDKGWLSFLGNGRYKLER